jgi:hypothetical protein
VRTAILVALALALQVTFGWPGAPGWLAAVLLPMVFVIGPPLIHPERRWPHAALALGLGWDLVLEPVIGPGAIAWSVSAVVIGSVVPLVTDRSPRAWLAFGALGALIMTVVRHLTLVPLGLSTVLTMRSVVLTVALTAIWCCLMGWLLALDLPARWRVFRARKLR